MAKWAFFTNHAMVLSFAKHPRITARETALP